MIGSSDFRTRYENFMAWEMVSTWSVVHGSKNEKWSLKLKTKRLNRIMLRQQILCHLNSTVQLQISSPWSPEGKSILLTCQADGGSVDDGHELLNVWSQQAVEQLLVPVLQRHQQDVPETEDHLNKHFVVLHLCTCLVFFLCISGLKCAGQNL